MAQTLQQQRAAFALEKVKALGKQLKDDERKEFRSYASALPAMIHMNGLGQALAFCLAKGGTYRTLYDILSEWMTREGQPYHNQAGMIEGIAAMDMHRYRLAQAEAMALLDWVKKFSLALLRDKEGAP